MGRVAWIVLPMTALRGNVAFHLQLMGMSLHRWNRMNGFLSDVLGGVEPLKGVASEPDTGDTCSSKFDTPIGIASMVWSIAVGAWCTLCVITDRVPAILQ
jgi:hypothetical protein